MYVRMRSLGLAVGAAALLSAQAVAAAPVGSGAPALDPLVSLSVLGTDQSRAAVCGAGAACTLPGISGATTAAAAAAAAAAQGDYQERGKSITWPLLIGALVIIALIIVIASSGGNDADGDLTPISP